MNPVLPSPTATATAASNSNSRETTIKLTPPEGGDLAKRNERLQNLKNEQHFFGLGCGLGVVFRVPIAMGFACPLFLLATYEIKKASPEVKKT